MQTTGLKMKLGDVVVKYENGMVLLSDVRRNSATSFRVEHMSLVLDVLSSIDWERRASFRIPVSDEDELTTKIVLHGRECVDVTPINVSKTGILINCPEASIALGDEVGVLLTLPSKHAELSGKVQRCERDNFGIAFTDSSKDQDALSCIVSQLETKWITRRVHGISSAL